MHTSTSRDASDQLSPLLTVLVHNADVAGRPGNDMAGRPGNDMAVWKICSYGQPFCGVWWITMDTGHKSMSTSTFSSNKQKYRETATTWAHTHKVSVWVEEKNVCVQMTNTRNHTGIITGEKRLAYTWTITPRCWERQGNNNNTTERQSNTIQLTRNSHFSKKNWPPRVGPEPTTISLVMDPTDKLGSSI